MRHLLLLLMLVCAAPAAAADPAPAPTPAELSPADYRADARSIEPLLNGVYAYPERFPGGRVPISPKLRAEAERVSDKRSLLRYAERALLALADHHAITGASTADSWAVVPSYSDLWIERRNGAYLVTAVRRNSPAERAGVRPGDRIATIGGSAIAGAVETFWADLGLPVDDERAGFAARILAAGKRNAVRRIGLAAGAAGVRELELPSLYSLPPADRPVLDVHRSGRDLLIRFNDSLGQDATIAAFDSAMASARPGQRIIIDLTETPGGGNTVIARAILGWFVSKPAFYQVHSLPAEQRRTGIPRQWVEQVLPREGKRHRGPVAIPVGRWTGSMGEGLAIGFDAIGARVEGGPMAGLLGAIYDHRLEHSGLVLKIPTERLSHVDGTPRERYVPAP
jgi:carboxyl-terminal processing protease